MDPAFLAMSVLIGSSVDDTVDSVVPSGAANDPTAITLLRALKSTDRVTRARALAVGIEPVVRALAAMEIAS